MKLWSSWMYDTPAHSRAKPARTRRPTAAEVAEIFEADYLGYHYRLVEFLAEHLADVSRTLGSSLQAIVETCLIVDDRSTSHRFGFGDSPRSSLLLLRATAS